MRSLFGKSCCSLLLIGQRVTTAFPMTSTGSGCRDLSAKMSASISEEIRVLGGIRDLVDDYDTFLLDMWGVMHDGTTTYEGVLDVIKKLKEKEKDLIILSNSSKRQDNSIKMLKKLGFEATDFSKIITSGEVSYHMLSQTSPDGCDLAPQHWNQLEAAFAKERRRVFCFGSGDGDEEYLESCGWSLSSADEADLIVARGTFTIKDGTSAVHKTHDGENAYFKKHNEAIETASKRRIPMIVANPDKIRPDADRSPMPGTIGNAYEKALGLGGSDLVKYVGKPFADVFEIALRNKDRSKACMVGDALETDVTGGSAEGVDTVWVVADGIHNTAIEAKGKGSLKAGCDAVVEEFNQLEDTYAKGRRLSPTSVLHHFRW